MSFPMENNEHLSYPGFTREDSPRSVPSLIHLTTASGIPFFDVIKDQNDLDSSSHHSLPPAAAPKTDSIKSQSDLSQPQGVHAVSISMPSSPMKLLLQSNKKVLFRDDGEKNPNNDGSNSSATSKNPMVKPPTFHSQSIPTNSAFEKTLGSRKFPYLSEFLPRNPSMNKFKDKRYNSFKTWSVKHWETGSDRDVSKYSEAEGLHVDRYFDALEGPELETLKASEEILLPEDKLWPFLLRYPVSSFGICLGISSQAIMWKNLAISPSMEFLHVSPIVNLILWCISLALVSTVSFIYLLKVIFYFEAVRREYYHPIRVNFFFAPWIALLFLAIGSPPFVMENLHQSLWYVLMAPIFCLELKIYGQWMSGGQRRLSKVANPSNHLSVVGNFVGALLGATMGLKEGPIFFFAIGLAHYTVLFVTLYQRLPTNETLPKDLHPVFFLFVAAPSVASMAWARIQGSFDCGSRVAYFVGLFLYFSLAVRVNFFRGFRFSIAWWAYTFPMTGASIATIKYSNEVKNMLTKSLALVLCSISTLTVLSLLITTIIHAFVLRDLFPNDISIAISENKHHNSESDCSDSVDLEKLP